MIEREQFPVGHGGDAHLVVEGENRSSVDLQGRYSRELPAVRVQSDAQKRGIHACRIAIVKALHAPGIRVVAALVRAASATGGDGGVEW